MRLPPVTISAPRSRAFCTKPSIVVTRRAWQSGPICTPSSKPVPTFVAATFSLKREGNGHRLSPARRSGSATSLSTWESFAMRDRPRLSGWKSVNSLNCCRNIWRVSSGDFCHHRSGSPCQGKTISIEHADGGRSAGKIPTTGRRQSPTTAPAFDGLRSLRRSATGIVPAIPVDQSRIGRVLPRVRPLVRRHRSRMHIYGRSASTTASRNANRDRRTAADLMR